jgi:hypothetical protein
LNRFHLTAKPGPLHQSEVEGSHAANVLGQMAFDKSAIYLRIIREAGQDMVGNVWEWVGDWGDLAQACTTWSATFGSDESCIGDGTATGATLPGALIRGGAWLNGGGTVSKR